MTERIIEIAGKKLYTACRTLSDDSPTLVFLHDSLGCTQLWRDFPERLSEAARCNVLLYDRLGYGRSFPMDSYVRNPDYMEKEADLLNDLLEALSIQDAILFGHSDGGTIALIAAAKYPDKIKAVICEAGHIFVEDITVKGVSEALHAYRTTNLAERLKKYHGDKVEMMVKAWTEIWLSNRFRNWNIEGQLSKIVSPLLFIQGEKDEYGTLDQLEQTVSRVSGISEKLIIAGAGHTPHKEVPELVLEKSAAFISRITETHPL